MDNIKIVSLSNLSRFRSKLFTEFVTKSWIEEQHYLTQESLDGKFTAAKLAKSVTLWGQSFDGSGDVSGDVKITAGGTYASGVLLNNVFLAGAHGFSGAVRHLYYGGTYNNPHLVINVSTGNVGIGISQTIGGEINPAHKLYVVGDIYATGKVIAVGGVQQVSAQSFSTLVQAELAATQSTRMRAKAQPTMIVEAGKQYYNDEENKVISEYKDFSATNQEAKILSKYPMTFAGENVVVENNDITADYLMYSLKYMQISEEKYLIAVSVSAFTSNGGDGFNIEKE